MHAHLHTLATGAELGAGPTALVSCLLDPVSGGPTRGLTLWEDAAAARAACARAGTGTVFEVEDVFHLPGGNVEVAALVEFDGPRTARQVAADRLASRQRVSPAAAQVPGTGSALCLRGDDGAMVVVSMAASEQVLEAASKAILSTPLLEGEDPELLGGPDRWTACRLTGGAGLAAVAAEHGARLSGSAS